MTVMPVQSSIESMTPSEFRQLQALIYGTTGIHLAPSKQEMLAGRLHRRLRALRIARFRDYLRHLQENSEEIVQMLDCVTTNETRFFREQKQFDFLRSNAIPMWMRLAEQRLRPRSLRIWSAGCSTGEEPYSVAMLLLSSLGEQAALWNVDILATDISTRVLDAAARGVWPIEKSADIPHDMLRRFMMRGTGEEIGKMKAGPEIRGLVRFARVNLNDERYPVHGPFDLILCRNVLIYFDGTSRRAAVERLTGHLMPGGYFLVGHAETLHGITSRLRGIFPTIYRRDQ